MPHGVGNTFFIRKQIREVIGAQRRALMVSDGRNRTAYPVLKILFALAVLAAAAASPAMAHHKSGHTKGKHKSAEVTEDNDNDGQPNTPDQHGDSDNRHPSGKDKHAEGGNSGNQGSSSSDPDDDGRGPDRSNGGADKPGGPGGLDVEDQDGNNGCGNDDDFEDDNEGWCGRKPHEEKRGEDVTAVSHKGEVNHEGRLRVRATRVLSAAAGRAPTGQGQVSPAVSQLGAVLPFTGAAVIPFVIIGLSSLSLGGALLMVRRRV